jgi:hypothetical protein
MRRDASGYCYSDGGVEVESIERLGCNAHFYARALDKLKAVSTTPSVEDDDCLDGDFLELALVIAADSSCQRTIRRVFSESSRVEGDPSVSLREALLRSSLRECVDQLLDHPDNQGRATTPSTG